MKTQEKRKKQKDELRKKVKDFIKI